MYFHPFKKRTQSHISLVLVALNHFHVKFANIQQTRQCILKWFSHSSIMFYKNFYVKKYITIIECFLSCTNSYNAVYYSLEIFHVVVVHFLSFVFKGIFCEFIFQWKLGFDVCCMLYSLNFCNWFIQVIDIASDWLISLG